MVRCALSVAKPASLTLLWVASALALAAEPSHPPAATKAAAAPPVAPAKGKAAPLKSEEEMLQTLRERLSAKLGNAPAVEPKHPGLVRVTARAEAAPEAHSAPARAQAAAHPAAAPHKAAPRATPGGTARSAAGHAAGHAVHWSYSGEAGPKAWGGLRPEFSLCSTGTRQSPIDIRDGIAVDLEPVQFDYRASPFRVVDNGHTVQVNVEPGNSIVARGERYELVQFHFHRPAEERINGRSFDMSLHLVHKDSEGRLAVIGLLLDRAQGGDERQGVVQAVWNNLPLEKNDEISTRTVIDLNHVLPPDRGYYTYMGSLTTPPCSEGVLWMVMRQPVPISAEQIAVFSRLYPMNARPVQQASGRMIKQSN